MRRLYTEKWSLGVERRFLGLVKLPEGTYVPHACRAYVALGYVLFQVYAPFDNMDPHTYDVPRRWRLAYIGRQTRGLP